MKPYEIVPGEAIGPFRLGMTRQEIGTVREQERARGIGFPLADPKGLPQQDFPQPGIYFYYDDADRCCKIEALFGYWASPPVFTLLGRVVNGMTARKVAELMRSIATDVKSTYAAKSSASAGLRAIRWEASDEHIMCLEVMPKKPMP